MREQRKGKRETRYLRRGSDETSHLSRRTLLGRFISRRRMQYPRVSRRKINTLASPERARSLSRAQRLERDIKISGTIKTDFSDCGISWDLVRSYATKALNNAPLVQLGREFDPLKSVNSNLICSSFVFASNHESVKQSSTISHDVIYNALHALRNSCVIH